MAVRQFVSMQFSGVVAPGQCELLMNHNAGQIGEVGVEADFTLVDLRPCSHSNF